MIAFGITAPGRILFDRGEGLVGADLVQQLERVRQKWIPVLSSDTRKKD